MIGGGHNGVKAIAEAGGGKLAYQHINPTPAILERARLLA
jgi:hypothetical protein